MELTKTKFKKTEVGLIPEEWEVKKLVELTKLFTKQTGFDYSAYIKPSLVQTKTNYTIPFLQNKDFNNKWINFQTDYYIPLTVAKQFPKILLDEKSLLISISGSIGNIGVYDSEELAFTGGAIAILKFKDSKFIDWTMFFLKSNVGQKNLFGSVKAGSHQNLILDDIRKVNISLPPFEEQKAIATALSDVDELIANLEKLIEKKKALKQGAMQQLLTPPHKGGKRLEGFSGEWVEKNLSDFCALITKGTTPTSLGREFTTSGVNFIKAESISQTGDILRDKVAFIDYDCHDLLSRSKLRSGDVLFTIAGVLGRIGLVQDENLPANTNQAVAIIRLDLQKSVSKSFIFHTLRSKSTMRHIESISVQGAQANFSLNDLNNLPIQIPIDIKEQAEIASVLSVLDSEVLKMVSKLDKLVRIKQGMMQELLTGRTRLI